MKCKYNKLYGIVLSYFIVMIIPFVIFDWKGYFINWNYAIFMGAFCASQIVLFFLRLNIEEYEVVLFKSMLIKKERLLRWIMNFILVASSCIFMYYKLNFGILAFLILEYTLYYSLQKYSLIIGDKSILIGGVKIQKRDIVDIYLQENAVYIEYNNFDDNVSDDSNISNEETIRIPNWFFRKGEKRELVNLLHMDNRNIRVHDDIKVDND